jgi:cell division septation protein DedD
LSATKPVAVPKPVTNPAPAPSPSKDWDFLKSRAGTPSDKLEPAQPSASATKPAETVSSSAAKTTPRPMPAPAVKSAAESKLAKSPVVPQGGMVLQVAALRSEADALALADALQQKQFPAFVLTPDTAGGFFRVQVGPYTNAKAADSARKALEREGFKSIVKR